MINENKSADTRSPQVFLAVTTVLSCAALAWFVWHSFNDYHDAKATIERDFRVVELHGTIKHLDEVLTMSARMAAATADLSWESRYLAFEPRLDAAIKEAMMLTPEAIATEAAAKTDEANLRLVEMEHLAFDHLRQGKNEEAKRILFSDQYQEQKRIYAQGMAEFAGGLSRAANASLQRKQHWALAHLLAMGLLMALMVGSWFVTFRATRKWINVITSSNRRLGDQTVELNRLNRTLDEKVNIRTEELASVNKALQAEVAERRRTEEELRKGMTELEQFNRLAVGREQRMIELKHEVNQAADKAGLEQPYDLSFASSHQDADGHVA